MSSIPTYDSIEFGAVSGWMVQSILLITLSLVLVASGAYYFSSPAETSMSQTNSAEKSENGELKLINSDLSGAELSNRSNEKAPRWLILLVAGFIAIQILPLLIAARKSVEHPLDATDIRAISFLIETPMYLGLLGSLTGVCITQYLTGSLAAPLAYLTTISGIVLYLFGKFSIWLELPADIQEN